MSVLPSLCSRQHARQVIVRRSKRIVSIPCPEVCSGCALGSLRHRPTATNLPLVLAPLITLPNRYHIRQLRHHLDPVFQARASHVDPKKGGSHPESNGFFYLWSTQDYREPQRKRLFICLLAGSLPSVLLQLWSIPCRKWVQALACIC